jgi:hypothetical protein
MGRSLFQFATETIDPRARFCTATTLMSGAVKSGRRTSRRRASQQCFHAKKLGQLAEFLSLGGLLKSYLSVAWKDALAIHASKWFQRDLGELVVHLGDSLRLRDECCVTRFRIFGPDFDGVLERFGARQFFEKCGAFLKRSFGIVGVGCRNRLEVLREVAGGSHSC